MRHVLALALWLLTFTAAAATGAPLDRKSYPKSPTLEAVVRAADTFAQRYKRPEILVVFDVDDTLLSSVQDLGSHAWFTWQYPMAKAGTGEDRVADTPQTLFEILTLLFAVGDMKPTQPNTPAIVKELLEKGHPVMALTARGPDNMSATLRELGDQRIAFSTAPACNGGICRYRGWITPRTIRVTAANCCGFRDDEKAKLLQSTRPAAYDNGIMMLAGQDKGLFLRMLLAAGLGKIKAVVFSDDSWKNIENMVAAFRPLKGKIALKAIYYTKHLADQQNFLASKPRQRKATETWRALKATFCKEQKDYCGR